MGDGKNTNTNTVDETPPIEREVTPVATAVDDRTNDDLESESEITGSNLGAEAEETSDWSKLFTPASTDDVEFFDSSEPNMNEAANLLGTDDPLALFEDPAGGQAKPADENEADDDERQEAADDDDDAADPPEPKPGEKQEPPKEPANEPGIDIFEPAKKEEPKEKGDKGKDAAEAKLERPAKPENVERENLQRLHEFLNTRIDSINLNRVQDKLVDNIKVMLKESYNSLPEAQKQALKKYLEDPAALDQLARTKLQAQLSKFVTLEVEKGNITADDAT
ncbi:MAG: hypothetical protein K2Z81_20275, partial [Cyanobacteria bacterium]|nr:hypothetical protein [Cyanobacteriota bacterium]